MFGLSFEHLLLGVIIFVFLAPRKLPQLAFALGKTIRAFKEHTSGSSISPNEPTYRKISETKIDE
jgi:Sec-independent protein translocase protein TatA